MALNYRPYEQQQLEALIPALNRGMDPSTAYSIFSGLQSGAVERAEAQRAQRQAMLMEAMGQMQQAAAGGMRQQGLEGLMESFQSTMPALARPKMDARLEGTLEALIPAGHGRSPLFSPEPMAPGEAGPLMPAQVQSLTQEPESVEGISAEATDLMTGKATGAQVPLHEARMRIMGKLRAMGYQPSVLGEAYDLIGQVYNSGLATGGGTRAGLLNAPLTRASYDSARNAIGLHGTANAL